MILTYPGHSEILIEITNDSGTPVRILSDVWLSSHAFGDMLARNPLLTLDFAKFPHLNAIFITHPHCDHFDPYSLVELYRHQRPAILLPETSLFLRPLLDEFLHKPDIFILKHGEGCRLFGINFIGWNFSNTYYTNEDDVMTLAAFTKREFLFLEADTALPFTEEARNSVFEAMSRHSFDHRLYVVTRNELEALYLSYDAKNSADRSEKIHEYRKKRKLEMYAEIEFADEMEDIPDIWSLPNTFKLFTGQGMIFCPEIDPAYLNISAPFPLKEVAGEEARIAKKLGRNFRCLTLEPGNEYAFSGGSWKEKKSQVLDGALHRYPVDFKGITEISKKETVRPVRNVPGDIHSEEFRILRIINERFLPYQLSNLEDPLKAAIVANADRRYCIEIRFGTKANYESRFYSFGFGDFAFQNSESHHSDEVYWANDLIDFLEGRQDVFTTTIHTFFEGKKYRLWSFLGMPFYNSDLVYNKIKFHFERAAAGRTVKDWVLETVREKLEIKKPDA